MATLTAAGCVPSTPRSILTNATLDGNVAHEGGVIMGSSALRGRPVFIWGQHTLTGCTVQGNTALYGSLQEGGGLYVAGGTVTLASDTLVCNDASQGGGLYVAAGTVALTNCTVQANAAAGSGGGVYIASGASVYLDSFTVANTSNNTAGVDPNIDGTYILHNP